MDNEIKDKLIEIQTEQVETQLKIDDMHAEIAHMLDNSQSEKYEDLFFAAGLTLVVFSFLFKMIK